MHSAGQHTECERVPPKHSPLFGPHTRPSRQSALLVHGSLCPAVGAVGSVLPLEHAVAESSRKIQADSRRQARGFIVRPFAVGSGSFTKCVSTSATRLSIGEF